jgi:hypothetical protein
MKAILLYLLPFISCYSIAQNENSVNYVPPEFINGKAELSKYAIKYIRYPLSLVEQGVSGIVNVTMCINKAGKVKYVNATGRTPEFNSEAKRVLKLSPDWEPGRKDGIPTDTMINLKVFFLLEN